MTPCQVCDSTERRLFIVYDGRELFRCAVCGLVYLDPMPTAEEIAALYTDAYGGASDGYFRKVPAKMRRSRRRVRALARLVPTSPGRVRRLLDVGANGGFMVEAARELGFEAVGLDLDPVSVEFARTSFAANRFHLGTVENFGATERAVFDAVYCSEVIEHVTDANAFVDAIARLMRPGAVLYLTTPDISHWRRPKDITAWDGFCPPAHCLYFSPANLDRLLARHGLRTVRRRFAWKPGIKLIARRQGTAPAAPRGRGV